MTINGNTMYCSGSFLGNGTTDAGSDIRGTTNIIYNGTGSWSHTGAFNAIIRNNLTINTAGTLTLGAKVGYNTGTLTYVSGTVVTTGNTLTVALNTIFNTNGITWNNVLITAGISATLNSLFTVGGTLTLPNGATTFTGTSGFSANTLNNTALSATRQYMFQSGVTYTVTNNLTLNTQQQFILNFIGSVASGTKAIFTLTPGASCFVNKVNARDIDSSLGRPIFNTHGIITRTINWSLTQGDFFQMFWRR